MPIARWPLILSVLLGACALEPSGEEARVASQRAAVGDFLPMPSVVGLAPKARLGSAVVACPGGGFVVSSPGDDRVLFTFAGLVPLAVPGGDSGVVPRPMAIGCRPVSVQSVEALVGGPELAHVVRMDGGVAPFSLGPVTAFGVPPSSVLPLAVVIPNANSTMTLITIPPTSTLLDAGVGAPTSIATAPPATLSWNSGGRLLVGLGAIDVVKEWSWSMTTLTSGGGIPDPNPGSTGFGRALLQGEVHPAAGVEAVVGAPEVGAVYVFAANGSLLLTLQGAPGFGASLALDPRDLGNGLKAFWVGDLSGAGQVHRFIGDAGLWFASSLTATMGFGAAVAVDEAGRVAVGAPEYSEVNMSEGAVFFAVLDAGLPSGEPMVCDAGASCRASQCRVGTCVGGVLCASLMSPCSASLCNVATNTCVIDAGVADAGAPDAGAADAGAPDAGAPDAGVPDAGAPDAGAPDAGGLDSGVPDAGGLDGGASDAGEGAPDAGKPDGGATTDGGTKRDGGLSSEPDAGLQPLLFRPSGCSTLDALPFAALALSLLLRRPVTRRRQRERQISPVR